MKFYGRTTGLNRLGEYYELSRESSLMNVITGRRRVGKTRLVREFTLGKNFLYFLVEEKEPRLLLEDFRLEVERKLGRSPSFGNWEEFFRHIFEAAKTRHLVIVLDEFQNLRRVDKRAILALRRCWDANKGASKVLMLCLGSQVGRMRELSMDRGAPLYGRVSGFFKLTPFNYLQIREILNDLGFREEGEKVMLYSIFGGVPHYYEILEGFKGLKLKQLVAELFLKVGGPLRGVGFDVLARDLGGAYKTYFSILQAISQGTHTSVEIGHAIGFSPTTLSRYLAELVRDELITRRVPVTEEESKSKRGRYFLADHLLRFWFRFIYSNRHRIERGEIEPVLVEVEKHLSSFIAPVFKDIVCELLAHYNDRSLGGRELSFEKIGSWWDRRGNELDVCAISDRETLLGGVHWGEGEVDVDAAKGLVARGRRLRREGKRSYLLVSKSGFTEECVNFMRERNFLALDLAGVRHAFSELDRVQEEPALTTPQTP